MLGDTDITQRPPEYDNRTATDVPSALSRALGGMYPWIYTYVSENLHHAASLADFQDKLPIRLQEHLRDNPDCCLMTVITKTVRDLVHDLNRTAIRRESRLITRSAFEDLVDPREDIERRIIEDSEQAQEQARVLALLGKLQSNDRELVEQVYGLHRCKLDRKQIAIERGVHRNTIDQQLRRIFRSIRDVFEA